MSLIKFTTSQTKGYVYETEFLFKKTNLPAYNIVTWDLGDGTVVYDSPDEVKHTYNYPGLYSVSLSAWTQEGSFETTKLYVDVDYKIRDALLIKNLPENWSIAGQRAQNPFVVQLTSVKINEPLSLVLHSINSDSIPHYAISDKWNFLVPTWFFVNAKTDTIVEGPVPLESVPIYGEDNKIIAVSAEASFYYIDYSSTIHSSRKDPIALTVTLSTEQFFNPTESSKYPYYSFANSNVKAATLWHILDIIPNELKISENFLSDIYPIKWSQTPIPVMVTSRFNPALISEYTFGSHVSAVDVFNYPRTNQLGQQNSVHISLSGVDCSNYTIENHKYSSLTNSHSSQLFFEAVDGRGARNSGYVFTGITSLCAISATRVIASTKFAAQEDTSNGFKFPVNVPLSYTAYISHPFENNINKIELNTFDPELKQLQKLKTDGLLLEGKITKIDVPQFTISNTRNLTLSGASGVYAIAYNPIKKLLYAADTDSNSIFLYNEANTLINTLSLADIKNQLFSSVPTLSDKIDKIPISPSSLSIDKEHNIWIALYDSFLTLKYDMNLTTYLVSAAPVSNLQTLFDSLDTKTEAVYTPSVVKTDQNSDIWVSYCHPLSGFLVKYDANGIKTSIHLDYHSPNPLKPTPVDLAISKENNVWVACRESNKVLQYNGETGELIQENCFDVLHPNYISVDKQNNLWVLHGYDLVTKHDTTTKQASSWRLTNAPFSYKMISSETRNLADYTFEEINAAYLNNEIWGGISIDVLNRVWVIDSQTNNCVVIPVDNPNDARPIFLLNTANKNYFIRSAADNFVQTISADFVRSAQAVGDWTGNEWYQKFSTQYSTQVITATSNEFRIYDLYKDAPAVAKINEDFNCSKYFKDLALPELLRENKSLLDNFFVSLVGSGSLEAEELGRVLYEKIANFTINHCDIETAEISQFISLFAKLEQEAEIFGVDFPVEIERLINIFSIPLHRLRGYPLYDDVVQHNIGDQLTVSSMITAGTYLYMKDKQYGTYSILEVDTEEETDRIVYPLSAIQITGLRHHDDGEFFRYYSFFNYNPFETIVGYRSNIIDWKNPYTNANFNEESEDFYFKTDGFVDLYFNNLLTKRLFSK